MLKSLEEVEKSNFQKVSLFLVSINPESLKPQVLLRLHQTRQLYQTFSGQISDQQPSIFFTAVRALVKQSFGLINPKHPILSYSQLVEYYTNEHEFSTQSADSTAHLMSSDTFHEVMVDLMEAFTGGQVEYLVHDSHLTLFYRPGKLDVEALNKFLHFNCQKTELSRWSFHWMPIADILKPPLKDVISGFDRVLLQTAQAQFDLLEMKPLTEVKKSRYAVFACESRSFMKGMYQGLYIGNLLEDNQEWESYRVHELQFPTPQKLKILKGIVISGSHDAVYDEDQPWIVQLKILVVDIFKNYPHVKLVGICYGHQMLASALGGVVCKMTLPIQQPLILKRESITLTQDFSSSGFVKKVSNKIAPGHVVESMRLIEVHGDHVQQLPPECLLYGSSKSCKVESFGMEGRVLTFQAHPQFNPFFTYQKLLLFQRMKGLVTEDFFAATAKNLVGEEQENHKLDRHLTFRFIAEFLK